MSLKASVAKGGAAMKKTLSAWDLLMLGIGGVIGGGVFVLTGAAAHDHAGRAAAVLAYLEQLQGVIS
jgi:APA family basic amino acid/polyamine antiporter